MAEYKNKEGMIDNRMVHDDHGRSGSYECDPHKAIKRVMQRGHDRLDYEGHFGGMGGGWKHGKESGEHRGPRRPGSASVPRKG